MQTHSWAGESIDGPTRAVGAWRTGLSQRETPLITVGTRMTVAAGGLPTNL